MVQALCGRLERWREAGEYLLSESVRDLRTFAHGDAPSLRLAIQMQHLGPESQRSVTITLVERGQSGEFQFRVKVEVSTFASEPALTAEVVGGWGLAHGLAVVALRLADKLPPIVDEESAA